MAGTTDIDAKLMRAKHVMKLLDISRRTLRNLEASRLIRAVVLSAQKRYVKEDVMRLMDPENGCGGVELWSPKQAADFIGGISTKTVTRMADSGKLRSATTPNGYRRLFAADVRKFVALNQGAVHVSSKPDEGRGDSDR